MEDCIECGQKFTPTGRDIVEEWICCLDCLNEDLVVKIKPVGQ